MTSGDWTNLLQDAQAFLQAGGRISWATWRGFAPEQRAALVTAGQIVDRARLREALRMIGDQVAEGHDEALVAAAVAKLAKGEPWP